MPSKAVSGSLGKERRHTKIRAKEHKSTKQFNSLFIYISMYVGERKCEHRHKTKNNLFGMNPSLIHG